jgi:putative membrane protein insertion efficiency factor
MNSNCTRTRSKKWIALPFLLIIKVYRFFSPIKQLILGPMARCRFHPTCSEYALECFNSLPLHTAVFRSLTRIFKCNPMHPGGYDPVHHQNMEKGQST